MASSSNLEHHSLDPRTTEITVVQPHVNDQAVDGHTDEWYGTTEVMRRMRAGDTLRFFDPITFRWLDDVPLAEAPQELNASKSSPIGTAADGLYSAVTGAPYNFPAISLPPSKYYPLQHWRSSVYTVKLARPPPASSMQQLPIQFVVQSGRSRPWVRTSGWR